MHKLYLLLNSLTGSAVKKRLPDGFSDQALADAFCEFFRNKIENLTSGFVDVCPQLSPEPVTDARLLSFKTVNKNDLTRVIENAKKTHCAVDPMPISDVAGAENFSNIVDMILMIVNISISTYVYPKSEKRAVIKPVLKGVLDCQSLSSFRPISNLSFLSKILEHVMLAQLVDHLERIHALPDSQSAYRQLYSTETAVCSVVSDLLEMMDEGK